MNHSSRLPAGLFVAFAALAVAVGWLSTQRPTLAALLVAATLAAAGALTPRLILVAAVGLLAYPVSVLSSPVQVAASDALLLVGCAGLLLLSLGGVRLHLSRLSPLAPALTIYTLALVLVWAKLPTFDGVITFVQRAELVGVALLAGVTLAHFRLLDRALTVFVCVATALSVAAVAAALVQGQQVEGFVGVHKNAAGQSIAGALLVVLFMRAVPYRPVFGLVLTLGLISAQSRGAIVGVVVAIGFGLLASSGGRRVRALGIVPFALGVLYAAYSALPSAQQERLVAVTPGGDYAAETRVNYADDAIALFRAEPILGNGLGRYLAGSVLDGTITDDPHNVLLLELAEGGVVLGGAFVILVLASVWVLFRRRGLHPIAAAAIAVQVSTITHGLVDVYWVRGTPVLGWVLVGAALWLAAASAEKDGLRGKEPWARVTPPAPGLRREPLR